MIFGIAILSFAFGAIWRRMYGGWLAAPKTVLLIFATIFFSLPAWYVWHDVDTCWRALVMTAAICLQFCLGAQFNNHWLCAVRYSLLPVVIGVLTAIPHWQALQWWWIGTGPYISLVYWIGRDEAAKGDDWYLRTPWDTPTQQMLNGYTTFGELAVGALSVMAAVVSPLIY